MNWVKLTTTGTPNVEIWANPTLIRCFVRGHSQPTTTVIFDANHKLVVSETPIEIAEKLAMAAVGQSARELSSHAHSNQASVQPSPMNSRRPPDAEPVHTV